MSKNKNLAIALGIVAVVVLVVVSLLSSADTRVTNESTKVSEKNTITVGATGILEISERKCHRLGGFLMEVPEGSGIYKCVIRGNNVATLPEYASVFPMGSDVVGNDPVSISKRKCRRLGGYVLEGGDLILGNWFCILPLDGAPTDGPTTFTPSPLNSYYDATIGLTEPISADTISKEQSLILK